MNKLFLICGVLLLIFSIVIISINTETEEDNTIDNVIDTGISPEQTWRIIHGEDVGEVLNLKRINK